MASAVDKVTLLKRQLVNRTDEKQMALFYVGDGQVDAGGTDEEVKQIDVVSKMLDKHGWRPSQFTYRESPQERESILNNFSNKDIDALVAIRCLDEGIDIPACREAFILASTRNERQFIQRRGRVLRKAPDKDYAIIYDYILSLPSHYKHQNENAYLNLLEGEFKRLASFSLISRNKDEVLKIIDKFPSDSDIEQIFERSLDEESNKLKDELERFELSKL